ncbi:hypothetical protein EGX47_08280 [Yersinia pseudotuberculosis]|uniref:Uncharacterized protein n=1 Tax=Yersinia pseudotuberculosis TaxID=633 RepID=A0ABM7AGM0_YERPU|nr:hypothetical protein EGX47_08280 [Yersinia pseudotuberculosis]
MLTLLLLLLARITDLSQFTRCYATTLMTLDIKTYFKYKASIILAVIIPLLNLYAKKFRCPDVLTSVFCASTLA